MSASEDENDKISGLSFTAPSNAYLSIEWQLTGAWGLHADKVWADYTGAGVIVTDLDDGFQINHPDFTGHYSAGLSYDFVTHSADGAAAGADDDHGTAVMGEIIGTGASGTGSLGVAYGAEAFGMRMGFGADGGLDQVEDGFQYALSHGAAVMNNSWGFTDLFVDDFSQSYMSGVATAMQNYADNGRGGLGGAIVFAAGNDRADGNNTNYHGMTNSPYVITVAAIDSSGHVADFSNPGTSILVSAAGVNAVTTDRTGNDGYVSGDYIYFSGTSAAAPLVSGTIALMLEANPTLGWRDVQQILAYSAQYNDPTSAGWQYNDAGNWNGGGLHYSADYGFGAANAFAAVRLAETWTLQQTSANMQTISGGSAAPHLAITAAASSSTITTAQNINVEHVLVNLDISETDMSGLTVTLIGPGGTRSLLIDHPASGTDTNRLQFDVSTLANWGETSAGQWRLEVQDTATGAAGTLNSWSLTFMGSAISANNTYFYTDDFANFSGAALAARSVIHDSNGGTDTLNLATVTSSSIIDLSAGTGVIAGHAITIAAGTVISNVYGGDGNDILTGSNADNYLYGGRGDDTLTAKGGTDTLNGGAGTDTAVFSGAVSAFSFVFTDDAHQSLTNIAGSFVDTLIGIEKFSFAGALYTLSQLETYVLGYAPVAPAGGGAGGLDTIGVMFSGGHGIQSTAAQTNVLTAADMGLKGTAASLEVDRDASGITLNYLSATASKALTIALGDSDQAVNVTGAAQSKLTTTINMGHGDNILDIQIAATVNVSGGDGDNTMVIAAGKKATITTGDGDNDITLSAATGTVSTGHGNNTIHGTGKDTISTGDGDNTIILTGAKATVAAGDGNNDITITASKGSISTGNGDNTIHAGDGKSTITVGDGDDTIYAGHGKNTIVLGGGTNTVIEEGGTDKISAGAGADTFIFDAIGGAPKISGFDASGIDKVDLSHIISYTDPFTQSIEDFVQITAKGSKSTVAVDAAGTGHFTTIATFTGAHLDLDTMIHNGSLIV